MRKNLFPLLASFAVCAAVTAGVVASTARAQDPKTNPRLVTLTATPPGLDEASPPPEGGMHGMREERGVMCRQIYAHQAGNLAYLEASLNVTPAQQPLFARWKQAKLDIAKRQAADCTGMAPHRAANGKRPSPIDGMAREQKMLETRLADLNAERPALEAFYNALSPVQKEEFRPGMEPRPHHMFAGIGHDMGRGMDRGMEGRPPGPPPGEGPHGDGPPPR